MVEATEYVCIKVCYYRNRLWELGETLAPHNGELVPRHFMPKDKAVVAVKKQEEGPKTFQEMNNNIVEEEKKSEEAREKQAEKKGKKAS